jgi:lipid-binding SYLF domain-containing protein
MSGYCDSIERGTIMSRRIKPTTAFLACAMLLATSAGWAQSKKQVERLGDASEVFQAIMDTPDQGIPGDLLERAACIGIIPSVKKFAIGFGGQHGSGYVLCRTNRGTGPWGAPSGFSMSGGSFGLQLGASATDYVLLFMNRDGVDELLQDKFTLGADASVAAGPVGRNATAATNAQMSAKILGYSRSKGLFAGLALNGAVLRPSGDDNEELYGRKVDPRYLLIEGTIAPPAAAQPLIDLLTRYSSGQSRKPL